MKSMTGYGRDAGSFEGQGYTWELKSVNGRGLDVRLRMPAGFDALDAPVRKAAGERLKRGNVTANLTLDSAGGDNAIQVNRAALDTVLGAIEELRKARKTAKPRPEGILALRGVLEAGGAERTAGLTEAMQAELMAGFGRALGGLVATRSAEGTRLKALIVAQVDRIESLTNEAGRIDALMPARIKERLEARLGEITASFDAGRLEQEVALLVTKADPREELDRLTAHVAQARELIEAEGPVGRAFDFLAQEFHREASTLCSKSADIDLTRIGLDLKNTIDQLKEQIQNVE